LHAVAQLVAGEQPPDTADTTLIETVERFHSHRQKLLRWGFLVLWGGLLILALGKAGDWMDHPERGTDPIWGILHSLGNFAPIVFVIGIGLMIYSLFLPKVTLPVEPRQPKTSSPKTEPTSEMPQNRLPEPLLSVTEQTTDLLERADAKVPARDTAPQG
jgi:hypothetical protein